MKTRHLSVLLLAGALLGGCNRTTDSTQTPSTGTTPATEQEIDQMATERERQTTTAVEDRIEAGDTVSTGVPTEMPAR